MDIWGQLMQGFATAGTPVNLLWAFVGCALGTAVGVLPGIGPATAVAMLLPITAKVEATASMIFLPVFTMAPCTAAPPPPSCSTRRVKQPAW